MRQEDPTPSQQRGKALFENISFASEPIKYLEVRIRESVPSNILDDITAPLRGSLYPIAALAIDALGNGDPEFLINVFNRGGRIQPEVLYHLSDAILKSRRKKCDAMEAFDKIVNSHRI